MSGAIGRPGRCKSPRDPIDIRGGGRCLQARTLAEALYRGRERTDPRIRIG